MPLRRSFLLPLSLLLSSVLALHALAEDLEVVGADGADSTDASPGEDGGDAVATLVDVSDASNTAIARGGEGGRSHDYVMPAGDGGGATATITASSASDLSASAIAYGGDGGNGAPNGKAGDAHASARATNDSGASIDVLAEAHGGEPGSWIYGSGNAGEATLGEVYGASTGGGDVGVTGRVFRGDTEGPFPVTEPASLPPDVSLIDAVDGDTTGALALTQEAYAGGIDGRGSAAEIRGGNAVSSLTKSTSSESLALTVQARGGGAGSDYNVAAPGTGGSASAHANGSNDAGSVSIAATAIGHAGGANSGGVGGAADASGQATTSGDAAAIDVRSEAVGGAGGGSSGHAPLELLGPSIGGAATSSALGIALGNSSVRVEAIATAGDGYNFRDPAVTPPAATADAVASGSNDGSASVWARAHATGGDAPWASLPTGTAHPPRDGGLATATASAISTGGGDATAIAIQRGGNGSSSYTDAAGSGADSVLDGKVSGSTSGRLRLEQHAIGGNAGSAQSSSTPENLAGAAGDAISRLDASNPGGGDLSIQSRATGGKGGYSARLDQSSVGGTAFVSATGSTDTSALDVTAISEGGDGGKGAYNGLSAGGGDATFGEVSGHSVSGDVTVRAIGRGGDADFVGSARGYGDGADVHLIDAVAGSTMGSLKLTQEAEGGDGGSGGTATSELVRSSDASDLTVVSKAVGGESYGGGAGNGVATVSATNRSGSVAAQVLAVGGLERRADGAAGDAHASAFAQSEGDGHDVAVGNLHGGGRSGIYSNSYGASGGENERSRTAHAGDAESASRGLALGDSRVSVYDRATGGAAGGLYASSADPGNATAGRGGSATSTSHATGAGTQRVESYSRAEGGLGGLQKLRNNVDFTSAEVAGSGRAGDASASSLAEGLGAVDSFATARGGRGLPSGRHDSYDLGPLGPRHWVHFAGLNGSATARAVADGATGQAEAEAIATGAIGGSAAANSTAAVQGHRADVSSHASHRATFYEAPAGSQGWAAASLIPKVEADDLSTRGALHFTGAAASELLAVGSLGGGFVESAVSGPTTYQHSLDLDFTTMVDAGQADLFLEVLDPSRGAAGFDHMALEISVGGVSLFSMDFFDADLALATLGNMLIDLGDVMPPQYHPEQPPSHPGGLGSPAYFSYSEFDLSLDLAVTVSEADSGFGFDFAVGHVGAVIPEPGTSVLFALGLLALAALNRGRRVAR